VIHVLQAGVEADPGAELVPGGLGVHLRKGNSGTGGNTGGTPTDPEDGDGN